MPAAPINLTAEKESASVILDTRRSRPRFFDGKFLTAADLTQEQSYLLTRQADLGRTLGFGVVDGLRVTRALRSASDLPNPAASVRVSRGHGLTPAGDLVFLPQAITIDLGNVAQMQRLNAAFGLTREPQQPFQNLRGLFVLGLRAVEFTANPTPAYPPSVDGNTALRDGEVIEATALTLVPYDSDASRKDARTARSRAAREIFHDQKIAPLPAGVLPLALLFLRNGALEWIDEWLVRREAGDDDRFGFGFAPRALSEAHFFHYQEMLREAPNATNGQLAARSFLEIIPPAGPLPKAVLNQDDFTQAYFPAEARVELALVPEDELAALMEDSIDLPPIDLNLKPEDQDALAILVLAPVKRADYGNVLQTLARSPQPTVRTSVAPLLSQQKPIQALLKLNTTFLLRRGAVLATGELNPADFIDPAWREVLKSTDQLWYLRRRNLPDGKGLAGTPLPVATEAAQPVVRPTDADGPIVRPTTPTDVRPTIPVTPTPTDVRPTTPVTPTDVRPTTPTTPTTPVTPVTPTDVRPTTPVTPTPTDVRPTAPVLQPVTPGVVLQPVTPVTPVTPVNPVTPVTPVRPTTPTVVQPTTPTVVQPVTPVVVRPTTPVVQPVRPGVVTPVRAIAPTGIPASDAESKLATQLATEGLWGRFAFLRAISDTATHAALVGLLNQPAISASPLLQQAVFAAVEAAVPGLSEKPEENFGQIQKGADLKVLTTAAIAAVESDLMSDDVNRGLALIIKQRPKLLSGKRHRATLGRTQRVGALAALALSHAGKAEFTKLLTAIERHAATGGVKAINTAIDRFVKKVNV